MREWRRDVKSGHAAFLVRLGVARWLIEAETAAANCELFVPVAATLLGAGLITDHWEQCMTPVFPPCR